MEHEVRKKKSGQRGWLIAGMGLPGSGKSSILRKLASSVSNAQVFLEPEESEWPEFVQNRDLVGRFTAVNWFRTIRVPMLYKANELRNNGQVAIVDTYYDKLLTVYLGRIGMEWLMSKQDSHWSAAVALAKADWSVLPNADVIVVFVVSEMEWRSAIRRRGRTLDRNAKVGETFATQEYFIEAAVRHSREYGSKVLKFVNDYKSIRQSADKLRVELRECGLPI